MSKPSMRILFVSSWYPYPADNGSRIRIFNLLTRLARRHEVTLLSFCREEVSAASLAQMESCCRSVQVVPWREYNPSRLAAWLGFLAMRPRFLVDTYSSQMQALFDKAVADHPFDVVACSQIQCVPYAWKVQGIPRVIEELELATLHDQFARASTPAARARHGLTWRKLAYYVSRLLDRFEGCTVASESERDLVNRIAPGKRGLAVVPNGVDLETNSGHFGEPHPETLIYSGALTYSANWDAMEFFLHEIWPSVQGQCPNAHLRITGKYSGVPVERLPLGHGVELTGYLEDIRPAVAQSWACIVPLRVGGGTRLKILEAMALGTPVVATSKGAEGLTVSHGENILLADNPTAFAEAVVRLFQDRDLRARLSENGRNLVERKYSWDRCASQLDELLQQVVQQGYA